MMKAFFLPVSLLTSPSPCEKCMSPIDRFAPSTNTGKYTCKHSCQAAGPKERAAGHAVRLEHVTVPCICSELLIVGSLAARLCTTAWHIRSYPVFAQTSSFVLKLVFHLCLPAQAHTLQPRVRFLMSQLPPCSRPGMVRAASLATLSH